MTKKLWGGRFKNKIDPYFEKFSSSIMSDYRLAKCDLIGSFLHIHILSQARLLTKYEFLALKRGILSCLSEVQKGTFAYDFSSEDIHTNIQNVLLKKAGAVALKLQTCRSRNEQVAFSSKLYCFVCGLRLQDFILYLKDNITALGARHSGLIVPAYTHLRHAQPIYFKEYLQAYLSMLERDAGRLEDGLNRLKISLGSGAVAGTPIPSAIYKKGIRKALKSLKMPCLITKIVPSENSLSDVSDRDFVIEFLSSLAILGMHISRLCEDLILWSSEEFSFIELPDQYCTGSSLMPQKKNPDALELMRGGTGTLYANLLSVLTVMKGLPLSYNRDMQLDKVALFSSVELIEDELVILADLVKSIKINKKNISKQLEDESLYATDLADYLVCCGVSFQKAHEIIGRLIRYAKDKGIQIKAMSQLQLYKFSEKLDKKEVSRRLDPHLCVLSKRSVKRR